MSNLLAGTGYLLLLSAIGAAFHYHHPALAAWLLLAGIVAITLGEKA